MRQNTKKKIDDLLNINIDDQGRYIIEMTILDDSNFISPYCGKEPIVSSEVATYLDNIIKNVPPKGSISLYLYSNVISKDNESKYQAAIKNYYSNEKRQLKRDLLYNQIAAFSMFGIGFVIIAVMLIFIFLDKINEIWSTILEIIGWVFVWEAVDKFVFERNYLKREINRADQLINAEVKFINGK